MKILIARMLGIKGSAEHSRWTCVDRPSCSVDKKITQQRAAQKMPSETTTACVRLLVFFTIRRGTFPYGVEDNASTISQTPTTHYTNTRVKLTIITHLSFSERIAIANLSFIHNRQTPSGQSRVCRVTQSRTDGVHCRESAGTGPVNLKVVQNECYLDRSPWTN